MGGEYNDGNADARGGELARRLARGPLVLDGATGTELERQGVESGLPLWSSHALLEAPEALRRIHEDYARAGVDAITAATFRTQRRVLERAGVREPAGELTARAVRLAREAARVRPAGAPPLLVLGSAPPLEDCYRPDLVPEAPALAREHGEHARHLVDAGVDGILVETHNRIDEALAATRAARDAGAPVVVSFVCWHGAALLSGEPLREAVAAVLPLEPVAVCVNCLPLANVEACLRALGEAPTFGVYPNLGTEQAPEGSMHGREVAPEAFAAMAIAWQRAGAGLVGGCCGTTPAHLAAVVRTTARG